MSKIHDFSMKWFDALRNNNTKDMDIVDDQSFADDCFSFEFKMDCGEAIIKAFQDNNVFNDWQEFCMAFFCCMNQTFHSRIADIITTF